MWGKRRRRLIDEATARVRSEYDETLSTTGMVLFQQVAPGEDGHYVSHSMARVLGWEPTAFRTPGSLRRLVHPDDLATFRSLVAIGPVVPPAALPAPPAEAFTAAPEPEPGPVATEPCIRFLAADGGYRSLLVRLTPTAPDEPVRGVLVDLSVSEEQRTTQRRFAEVVERSPDAHLLLEFTDLDDPASLVVRSANPAARGLFNLEPRAVDGTRLEDVFGPGTSQLIRSALFDVAHTGQALTADRLTFPELPGTYLDLRVDRLDDGMLWAGVSDVTRVVTVEERLRHQAHHDALTGLPNRSVLDERLQLLSADCGPDHHVALVLVEVDGLAELNAARGHHHVDRLLVEVGRALGGIVPAPDLVARIGGNEFAVLTPAASTAEEALEQARAVSASLNGPFEVEGDVAEIVSFVGAAVAPRDGDDPRTLLRSADAAVQVARADAQPFRPYDPAEERSSLRRIGLLTQLRRGLADQDLELRFQPVVDLRTGRVDHVEALLRWQREDGGARLPVELLELAEQSGLVQPLTRWVLGEAARVAGRLSAPGSTTVVSANLSMRNLGDAELLSFLELLLASGELPAGLVEVEITETELADDPIRARQIIDRLSRMGLRVVVDNFGTGYTALPTMAELAITGVKIDRSFISTLSSVPADLAVVRSTVEVAHDLGLTVTAEGVADADTLALLAEMGCDRAQGFHLSGPVTLEALPGRVVELEEALRPWVGSRAEIS